MSGMPKMRRFENILFIFSDVEHRIAYDIYPSIFPVSDTIRDI